MVTPFWVSWVSALASLAMPKSMILAVPSSSRRTLSGLMSRWITPLAMGVSETVRYLQQHLELVGGGERCSLLDQPFRAPARQILLHQIGDLALETEGEDPHDMPVLELAGDLGLAEEPLAQTLVGQCADLDRDFALEEGVTPAVDNAEATITDLLGDLVLADLLEVGHSRRIITSVPRPAVPRPAREGRGGGRRR